MLTGPPHYLLLALHAGAYSFRDTLYISILMILSVWHSTYMVHGITVYSVYSL